MAEYSIPCPVLHRDRIGQLPVSEDAGQARDAFSGLTDQRRVTKIVIVVPFDGEEDVFGLRPSQFGLSTPAAEVRKGELRLTWISDQGAEADPEAVRRCFDGQPGRSEQLLGWARALTLTGTIATPAQVSSAVAERRAKLLADRQLEAGIGFPVRHRADASQFSVPVSRRNVEASYGERPLPAKSRFCRKRGTSRPLAVLRNARNALERTPSMTANLEEEKIRDLLLVLLNAQFEGAAA